MGEVICGFVGASAWTKPYPWIDCPTYSQEKCFQKNLKFTGNGQSLEWPYLSQFGSYGGSLFSTRLPTTSDTTSKLSEHYWFFATMVIITSVITHSCWFAMDWTLSRQCFNGVLSLCWRRCFVFLVMMVPVPSFFAWVFFTIALRNCARSVVIIKSIICSILWSPDKDVCCHQAWQCTQYPRVQCFCDEADMNVWDSQTSLCAAKFLVYVIEQ